jgi:hypothetical protein
MFAVLSAVCFLLVLLGATLGGIDLTTLGLLFLAIWAFVGNWPFAPFALSWSAHRQP